MKVYELPNGKNRYGFLDMETGYDYFEKRIMPGTQSRLRRENEKAIEGCVIKTLYDLDNISMLYISIEPSVKSTTRDFVCHTGHEEILLVLSGEAVMEFPDGEKYDLKVDDAVYLAEGIPHRIINTSTKVLKYVVCYTGPRRIKFRVAIGMALNSIRKADLKNLKECEQKLAPGFRG